MTGSDLGTLTRHGDDWVLAFTRWYVHPIDRVWQAVTDPSHQSLWFPQLIRGERRAGAPLRFITSLDPEEGFDGRMLAYDPPRLMEMLWGESRVRIELTERDGGTRLRLTETLTDVGTGARNGAGWHECIDRLSATVESTTPHRWGEQWRATHARYVSEFGAAASSIGPPEECIDGPNDPYVPKYGTDSQPGG